MGRDRGSRSDPDVVKWILSAIERVKKGKKRPDLNHIVDSIRETNSDTLEEEVIKEHLNSTVDQGLVEKTYFRGGYTFKIVSRSSPRKQPPNNSIDNILKIQKETDLTEVVTLAIQALGEDGGSTLKSIERFITRNYEVDCENGIELGAQLRSTTKRAVSKGKLNHEGRYYSVNDVEQDIEETVPESPKKNNSANNKCNATAKKNGLDEESAPSTPKPNEPEWRYEVIVEDIEKAKV